MKMRGEQTMSDVKDKFRESMSQLAAGVTIVMTEIDGRPWGLTVSACCSISMEPPLIMVSLATNSASTQAIIDNDRFSVSLLAADQIEVAKAGAKAGAPKFFEDFVDTESEGHYEVKNTLANIHCKVDQVIPAGDHTMFIGLVENVVLGDSGAPLVYFHRQFGEFRSSTVNK
ncbi:flavin reductase family protein [Bacillus sp. V5-8f]|uniref:flavin reductase family protein n=1 Tax=Bacillus sp. V5-8f TaxID=2053044 RepID=UPI000C781518|nr:flavin reductase family protein [Bacillus sp. V5-8f]PLT35949.1 flavin reductase [Bacillus sp. V5-8f]